jgi:phospholipase/carboxylesterase
MPRTLSIALLFAVAASPPARTGEARPTVSEGELAGVKFLETVTPGEQASSRLPLLIALHPQGGSPADFLSLFDGLKTKVRIILPAADEKNGLWSWYRGSSTDAGAPGPRRAAKRLKPFIARLLASRPVAGKPIVVGYSQGAIMGLTLAITEPTKIGTVVSMSGRLPPAMFPEARGAAPGPAVEAFHGKLDRTVPYAACRKSIAILKSAGFSANLTGYEDSGHEITEEEARQVLAAVDQAAAAAAAKP